MNIFASFCKTEILAFLVDITSKASDMLRERFVSKDFYQRKKQGVDFTTEADIQVDAFLRQEIGRKYPQIPFLTEETAPRDYIKFKECESLWVIDPLDGTTNFSRQNPHFSISIALVNKGVPKIAFVRMPITGDYYWACDYEENAYFHANNADNPIKVSSTRDFSEAVIACDWPYALEKRTEVLKWLGELTKYVRQAKVMGSSVADLASLARGCLDLYMHPELKPWDVAASSLLIRKAGGKISTPTGKEWNIFEPSILATNGVLHEKVLEIINS